MPLGRETQRGPPPDTFSAVNPVLKSPRVSGKFVAMTETALAALLAADLSGLDLVALTIDGVADVRVQPDVGQVIDIGDQRNCAVRSAEVGVLVHFERYVQVNACPPSSRSVGAAGRVALTGRDGPDCHWQTYVRLS